MWNHRDSRDLYNHDLSHEDRDGDSGSVVQREEDEEEYEDEDAEEFTAEVWDALDSLEQIRPTINAGPRWKLETFLEAMDILEEAQLILEQNDCPKGMRDAESLLNVASAHLLDEFRDALSKNSKPMSAEMLREVALSSKAGQLAEAVPGMPRTPSYTASGVPSTSSFASSPSSSASSSPTSSGAGSRKLAHATQVALQDWLSAAAVPFLHRMACKLLGSGQEQRAVDAYVSVRMGAIQQSMKELRIKSISSSELENLSWSELEQVMKSWIQDMRTVVLVLLGGESALCDEIFEGLDPERQTCFLRLVQDSGFKEMLEVLVGNAKSIAVGKNCPERLFALLDMFTAVRELKPNVEGVSGIQGFSALVEDMESLPRVIAMAVRNTLAEFEAVLEEPPVLPAAEKKKRLLPLVSKAHSDASVPEDIIPAGAGIHPVTSYVVNYISGFLDRQSKRNYPGVLEYLLLEYSSTSPPKSPTEQKLLQQQQRSLSRHSSVSGGKKDRDLGSAGSVGGAAGVGSYSGAGSKLSLPEVTGSLLGSLMHNLEARARASPDVVLGALFLLNNAVYVHRNMSDPKHQMLADIPEWKDGRVVESYAFAFEDAALSKVTASIGDPGDVRSKLKKFNVAFEELAIKQAGWAIVEEDRRKGSRVRMARRLKEMYATFLLPYREELCEYKSYRYTPNAIERVVLDYFFLGTPTRGLVL